MIRTIPQIERELAEAEAVCRVGGVEQRDNDGNLVMTAQQHLAAHARRARRLQGELDDLRAVFGRTNRRVFYVTARVDSRNSALLLGPYDTQEEAEAQVDVARRVAPDVWPARGASFWRYGTSGVTVRSGVEPVPGQLHQHLPEQDRAREGAVMSGTQRRPRGLPVPPPVGRHGEYVEFAQGEDGAGGALLYAMQQATGLSRRAMAALLPGVAPDRPLTASAVTSWIRGTRNMTVARLADSLARLRTTRAPEGYDLWLVATPRGARVTVVPDEPVDDESISA